MNWNMIVIAGLACLCAAALTTDAAANGPQPVSVTNYKDGETIRYPLVLLRGDLADKALKSVSVINESSKLDSREMQGLAYKGQFKAFAELVPGANDLVLKTDKDQVKLTLTYKPQTNPYKVRAVMFTDKTGDPTFETPFKDDQDYRAKWDAALKLLQTFTADEMNRQGYGRRTFNLELDKDGKVIVHIVKGKGAFEEMQKRSGGDAYDESSEAIQAQLPAGPYKNLVCVAFSRHVKETGHATAYAALGGGDVALMGGACFFAWPTGVKNIQKTFMSDVQIDDKNYHADDVGRFAVWATAATTVGSGLHELGHAFSLPHTRHEYQGIMLRGADILNRYVAFLDPPCRGRSEYTQFKATDLPCWDDVSAAALAPTREFALDQRPYTQANTIRFALDPNTAELVVRSDDGLEFVCVEIPGAAESWVKRTPGTPAPKEVRQSLREVAKRFGTPDLTVRVVDGMGHYRDASLKGLLTVETNLTTGKPVTASGQSQGNPAADAVDGSLDTYWDANPYPQWLQVDLRKPVTLDEIRLYGYVAENRYYQYVIELSLNGKTWKKVVDESRNEKVSTDEGYRHKIEPTQARYIKVTMLKNSVNTGVHIRELWVFQPGEPSENPLYKELQALFAAEASGKK